MMEEENEKLETQPEQAQEPTREETAAADGNAAAAKKESGFERFFGIRKSGSTVRTEVIAGLTTFMAMVYALLAVPAMFGGTDVPFGAIYIATALGAVVGTTLMGLLARMPLAQASGLGAAGYITGTLLAAASGLTYANAMIFVLLDGIIFVILTATGLRKKILKAIPQEVRIAIPVGIGMFIAFIGFKSSGTVIVNQNTGWVDFASFNVLNGVDYLQAISAAIVIFGVIAIGVMSVKKVKGAILWGILGATALYYALAGLGCAWQDKGCLALFGGFSMSNPFAAFADWGKYSVGQVFVSGFDFSKYFAQSGTSVGTLIVLIISSALSLCMIDMFDTIGTLYGACSKGGLLDEEGTPLRMNQCMLSDAVATCVGSVCGAPTVTTYVEASSGVAAGGRTGFAAIVTAACFAVATFLSPIASIIPSCATSAALVWVGVLMMSSVKDIDWNNFAMALPAFLTVAVMAFGFSISYGIGIGLISCVLIKVCTGKVKEISVVTWVITALFLATFLITH